MSRMSRAVGSWRPVLRLASRDALRHRTRTVLSGILIALPVAALVGFIAMSASSATSAEQALRSIPAGADAVITATAISREAPPFEQLPEGPQALDRRHGGAARGVGGCGPCPRSRH